MQPKIGASKRGWLLIKASWKVLKLDMTLINFSVLNVLASALVIGLFAIIGVVIFNLTGGDAQSASAQYDSSGTLPGWAYLLLFLMFLPLFVVMNYFTACITAGALQRFRGEDPTIKSSVQAANKIVRSLLAFSFYQNVAIWAIDALRRVRFIGTAMAFLGELGFAVGTFFALPIMVDRQGAVGPLGAIKQSAALIRKTWGESIIVSLGMLVWAVLAGVLYTALWCFVLVAATPFLQPTAEAHEVIALALLTASLAAGYGIIMVVYSALSSITTTALYLYATTGEVPAGFDANLLKGSVRPKTSSDI